LPKFDGHQHEEDKNLRDQIRNFRSKGVHERVKTIQGQVVGFVDGKE